MQYPTLPLILFIASINLTLPSQAVVDSGALEPLAACLEEFDPTVKESAAWALGYIARHNTQLAQSVVDVGSVPLLILCVQEPEISLKRISASSLSDIAKHSPELAQTVVDAGAIAYLVQLINSDDAKLKRQVFSALAQVSHTPVVASLLALLHSAGSTYPSQGGLERRHF